MLRNEAVRPSPLLFSSANVDVSMFRDYALEFAFSALVDRSVGDLQALALRVIADRL
jgi:hypothetical protein